MAASYTAAATLATDTTFRDRVRMAIMTAGIQVMGETKNTSDTVFGKRQGLAYAILSSGGLSHLEPFCWAVAANVAIEANSNDSDIQFTVNSLWADMAGVRIND